MSTNIPGTGSLAKVDTIGGGAYVSIADQLDATVTMQRDIIESTTKDSSQLKENEYGNFGWTVAVSCNLDSTAAGDTDGQVLIRTSLRTGVKMDFQFLEAGTADTLTGDVLVQDVVTTYAQNAIQSWSCTLVGDGDLVPA